MPLLIALSKRSALISCFLFIFIAGLTITACNGNSQSQADDDKEKTASDAAESNFPQNKVLLTTEDRVTIYGTFVYIDDNKRHPATILCHQFKRNRSTYADFQILLAENGINSLAIDFRGFGESTDDELSHKNFGDQDYIDMLNDIKAAIVFLVDGPGRERVDDVNIGLVGASIGANLAIMAGAEIESLKCTAALSPGRSWHGLEPIPYAPDVEIPVFIAYAKGDKQSADVIPDLTEAFGENEPSVKELDGRNHGTDMLADGLDQDLMKWLKGQLSE